MIGYNEISGKVLRAHKGSKFNLVAFAANMIVLTFLAGCGNDKEKKDTYQLLSAGNGIVYRIDKSSGEVALIKGAEIRKLEEWRESKSEETNRNYLVEWGTQTNSPLGGIALELKTNWREGKMYYIFGVSPYRGRVQAEPDKTAGLSQAQFTLGFYDTEGFQLLAIPIQLSEMSQMVNSFGTPDSLSVNSTISCPAEIYQAFKSWSVSWAGFETPPALSPSVPVLPSLPALHPP